MKGKKKMSEGINVRPDTDYATITRSEYDFLVSAKTVLNAVYAYAVKTDVCIADDVKTLVESMTVLPWGMNTEVPVMHIGGKKK